MEIGCAREVQGGRIWRGKANAEMFVCILIARFDIGTTCATNAHSSNIIEE